MAEYLGPPPIKKRIAIDIPEDIHNRVRKHCEQYGFNMTQWIIQLVVEALEL